MKKPILSVLAVAAVVFLTAGSAQARATAPDSGSTLSLFGMVLLGFGAIRRFLKK